MARQLNFGLVRIQSKRHGLFLGFVAFMLFRPMLEVVSLAYGANRQAQNQVFLGNLILAT
jgi:hypothetical protein